MSDEAKFGVGMGFLVLCLMVAISVGVYNSNENTYREHALAASTEIAKARLATQPTKELAERLDAILLRLERIEKAVAKP